MRPVVLLDCDGVLSDFTGAYLKVIEDLTGSGYSREVVDRWHIKDCAFFRDLRCRYPDIERDINEEIHRPGFAGGMDVLPGAGEAVARLREMAEVYVVSSPWWSSPLWMYERTRWLGTRFGLEAGRVIQTSAKHRVHGDVLVDDHPGNVQRWQEEWAWTGGTGILFDSHSNVNEDYEVRGGWDEVIQYVEARVCRSSAK